ncbi:beta-lactamase family protein [Chryseobacterium aquaticum]|uniref:Beta-lactamase family protein n=1 Tax=Chryseobacterium aquaticum TaxID=452084 RepID=A0A848N5Z4_9FLAO|nr:MULTISPECIES: serine hydrolase domain-containing protein [Chryseobacterium]NMR34335.1 beta-lactamase family protein [Chryseobacterium aquaticum]NRQ46681.1 beta-lactamase family protein [Chryseobacterium sp. C-204]
MKNTFIFLFSFLIFNSIFAQQIVGSWKGELEIQGNKLPLIINIKQESNNYISTLDSPLQGAEGIPLDKTSFSDHVLTFENAAMNATFKGTVNDSEIIGTFNQNGMSIPLTLKPFDKTKNKDKDLEILKLSDTKESLKKINEYLSYLEKNNALAGEISLFKKGKEIYKRNFGEKNLPDFKSTNQTYQIGSISKTMTAIMIFKLIESKQLNLTDKLSQFFPQIPNSEKITISQILNHSSGLGDYVESKDKPRWLSKKATDEQIINIIIEQGSQFEPGIKQKYSNSGYYLLAKILEKVSKKSYKENLSEYIIKPLQLKQLYTAREKPSNTYKSYSFNQKWIRVTDFDFMNIVGVGDIATTPYNLNLIINAVFNRKLVSEESLKAMIPNENRFGKGLAIVPFHSKIFVGHSGGTYGTNSLMIYNGEDDLSISYSLNADRIGIAGNEFVVAILSMLYGVNYALQKSQ